MAKGGFQSPQGSENIQHPRADLLTIPQIFSLSLFCFHSHCRHMSFLLFSINYLKVYTYYLRILISLPYWPLYSVYYTQVDLSYKTFLNGKSHSPCFSPFCLINHVNHILKLFLSWLLQSFSFPFSILPLWPTSAFHSPPSLPPIFFHECDITEFIFWFCSVINPLCNSVHILSTFISTINDFCPGLYNWASDQYS